LESFSWAKESIEIACKWGYEGVKPGATLAGNHEFMKLQANSSDS